MDHPRAGEENQEDEGRAEEGQALEPPEFLQRRIVDFVERGGDGDERGRLHGCGITTVSIPLLPAGSCEAIGLSPTSMPDV